MRYFITGATGFIGQHLCSFLVAEGHEVVALLRTPSKRSLLPESVTCVEGSMDSFSDRAFEIPEVDVVVHLAGTIAASSAADYRRGNYGYTVDFVRYLESRSWRPRRLLFASSLAAAGPTERGAPRTEAHPLLPIDDYGQAKADSETFLQQTALAVTAFRPPIVFGAGDGATWTLFEMARRGVGFQVGGLPQQLSFVDVRDLVAAIELMSFEEGEGFKSYFTSHPDQLDSRVLWTELGRALGRRVRVIQVPRVGLRAAMRVSTLVTKVLSMRNQLDAKQYKQLTAEAFTASSERLRGELGWAPQYSLRQTLADAVSGYRAAGWMS